MKKLVLLFGVILFAAGQLFAQTPDRSVNGLPIVYIGSNADIHFLSPEPIQYADISTHAVAGDLPVKNILRIRVIPDSLCRTGNHGDLGVVTVTGESYIAQYHLLLSPDADCVVPEITIKPEDCRPLDVAGVSLTENQLRTLADKVLAEGKHNRIRHAAAYGLSVELNQVYTAGDDVFLDVSFYNRSNLTYDPDEIRFKIDDKKITKATNVQSVELKPVWQLYPLAPFKKRFHNIYVLKKATFPDNKLLTIELAEKQVSGRTVTLQLKYGDLLHADAL